MQFLFCRLPSAYRPLFEAERTATLQAGLVAFSFVRYTGHFCFCLVFPVNFHGCFRFSTDRRRTGTALRRQTLGLAGGEVGAVPVGVGVCRPPGLAALAAGRLEQHPLSMGLAAAGGPGVFRGLAAFGLVLAANDPTASAAMSASTMPPAPTTAGTWENTSPARRRCWSSARHCSKIAGHRSRSPY